MWGRVGSSLTPWCAKRCLRGGEPFPVRWEGIPYPMLCDKEPLFRRPCEPKVIHGKRERGTLGPAQVASSRDGNFPSEIRLDHGDLLVMDGLTPVEFEHSTSSVLLGPRVNLTFRQSCAIAGLIGCVLHLRVRKVWLSRARV